MGALMRLPILLVLLLTALNGSFAADLIVSANDGKFVRVEGGATYPQPAPPDSLAVIDASVMPPKIVAIVTDIEHTIAGPPQSVAITPDGQLAVIAAPSKYDYTAKKETLGTFLQVVDLSTSPPKQLDRIEIGAHPNGLSINPAGSMLLAATSPITSRRCIPK
jgi:hypothetical protein